MTATHQVENQPPELAGYNAFTHDAVLQARVLAGPGAWIAAQADALGALVGAAEWQAHAAEANRSPPVLATHDRFGHRLDEVRFHPAYHALMQAGVGAGVAGLAWSAQRPGAFSARATLFLLWNQLEQGTACPMTMTFAGRRMFDHAAALAVDWVPKITAHVYDPRPLPVTQKTGAMVGMAMTEKQGGSDLRAVQTTATPADNIGGERIFALTGHKWFCSAPMSDGFFTLARQAEGVSCFFVPRSLPDGRRNPFLIQRLKEKIGNRSNASSEIEYRDTLAWPVGEAGRGIATLIEMAHLTRFDIIIGVAGMMRAALHQVTHHIAHRQAFGRRLAEQPLMQAVVADLALESEAALALALRVAAAFDQAELDEAERLRTRLLVPVAKYWLCKRLTPFMVEAMECFGGNGYVDEHPLARLYREAPLNGIWEGSGNVICLDVLRSLQKSPASFEAVLELLAPMARTQPLIEQGMQSLRRQLAAPDLMETTARAWVEQLALLLQAALLCESAPANVADAFLQSRLARTGGQHFGTLPAGLDLVGIAARAQLNR